MVRRVGSWLFHVGVLLELLLLILLIALVENVLTLWRSGKIGVRTATVSTGVVSVRVVCCVVHLAAACEAGVLALRVVRDATIDSFDGTVEAVALAGLLGVARTIHLSVVNESDSLPE